MSDLLFDTCFLIDLEREERRGPAKAHAFLSAHSEDSPWISCTVMGEFAEGFGDLETLACTAMFARFDLLVLGRKEAKQYARIASELRRKSQLIGANDLWIAATALAAGFPLVTNNIGHFARVSGLVLVSY